MQKLLAGAVAIFFMIYIAIKLPFLFLAYLGGICIFGGLSSIKDKQIPFAIFEFICGFIMIRILIFLLR